MRPTIITPALETPVDLETVKKHLRVDSSFEDTLIELYNEAATTNVEEWLGRSLITQTLEYAFPHFPAGGLVLPMGPVQEVEVVEFDSDAGDDQVFAGWSLVANVDQPYLDLAAGAAWPTPIQGGEVARVRYVAGYGDPEDVPAPIRAAILLEVGNIYANRESLVIGAQTGKVENPTARSLLAPYKIWD